MSLIPAQIEAVLHRELVSLLTILALWTGASGVVLIANSGTLSKETAWQPAQFGHTVSLAVYGAVFLAATVLILAAAICPRRWKLGAIGALLAGFCSAFLAFTLIAEATHSSVGWLGAVNYLFDAMLLGLTFRLIRIEHPVWGR